LVFAFSSCKKYVDAGSPANQLTEDKVFVDSATTLSSVLSLYTYYTTANIINLNQYGSMSADDGYYFNNSSYDLFRTNTLAAGNYTSAIYNALYQTINLANYNLEGLTATTSLTTNFKTQLLGECEFWRAYCYFNLLNYFGAVPLVINTNALTNAKLPRTDTAKVYDQIVADLLDAKIRLTATYGSYTITEKARINKYVVSAFLARVYLYRGNWTAAEAEATSVIGSGLFNLETNFANVFLKTSNETIWQDAAPYYNGNTGVTVIGVTQMGVNWIPSGTVPLFILYDTLASSFETGDKRQTNWTQPITYNSKTYYYPYKYKNRNTSVTGNEYNVMFRLAEQYLIRSEARARQGNISGAQDDINAIRTRAGLANTPATTPADLLTVLEHERWVELFTEMSDRWFNLKRTGRTDAVFSAETEKKSTWKSYQALYPIPQPEIIANPNMTQNPQY